jgi:hypothetical protein
MNEPEQRNAGADRPDEKENAEDAQGPNLKLLYGLIALALAAAIAIAAMIVLPFYRRR